MDEFAEKEKFGLHVHSIFVATIPRKEARGELHQLRLTAELSYG